MPRKRNQRVIRHRPQSNGFMPVFHKAGISSNEAVELHYEEYETIYLLDYEGLSQEEAATFLEVSRPTLTRIYLSARKKIAIALAENKPIVFSLPQNNILIKEYYCRSCQTVIALNPDETLNACPHCNSNDIVLLESSLENGRYRNSQQNGYCICPECHTAYPHTPGLPCRLQQCKTCKTFLIREGSAQHQLLLNKKNN